ncbi:MAG: polysaccharide biosynthesis C-terminal domain-containing protein [Oscillospiraceae bacterium]|nr:polysaccharide biosynthesis C-terminal domain-containing protein [Oscillospiraceae bacterium]
MWAFFLYIFDKRKLTFAFSKTKDIFFSFFKIAIPDAVGSWARYSLTTAEHILIPMGLRKSGQNASASLSLYGMVQGMALPIILFPSSLMVSLSSMLIPEVAEHHARGSARQIDYIISRVISISLLFSIGTMGVMYNYSYELANAIYKTADIADYIKILSAVIPVMYTDIVVDSFLKGLDKQVDSMRYNILDAFLCVLLVYFLIPKFAIKGYIITIFASEIINFVLSLRKLISITSFKINLLDSLVKPIFCILSAVAITNLITLNITLSPVLELCFKVLICLILYILTHSLFGAITKEDKVWFYNLLKN